ncbi:MAG: hypothetical protein R3266_10435, partial [Gemmatimonadota bacterium]|nr:hypothetical protein [Gemmatimonadota bacterium]
FTLLARDPNSVDEARELLGRYAETYPDSVLALAAMQGELALGLVGPGGVEAAEASLAEARRALPERAAGPLDAVAARLALFAGLKDSVAARAGRSAAQDELEADERTRRLQLLTLAQVADSAELALAGRAALELYRSPRAFDPGATLGALAGLPDGPGRPVVLAFLADRAEAAGRTEVASALRRRIVEVYPTSAEAPPALLDLARSAGPEEAAGWLERLVIEHPESALAPMARRLLDELRGG